MNCSEHFTIGLLICHLSVYRLEKLLRKQRYYMSAFSALCLITSKFFILWRNKAHNDQMQQIVLKSSRIIALAADIDWSKVLTSALSIYLNI